MTDQQQTQAVPAEVQTSLPSIDDVEEAMRDVVDPELGINVVDLGLVYGIDVDAEAVAKIDMTLTSAACPLTDVIETSRAPRWSPAGSVPTSRSTGCGCRRGGRTRSRRRSRAAAGSGLHRLSGINRQLVRLARKRLQKTAARSDKGHSLLSSVYVAIGAEANRRNDLRFT